MWFVCLMFGQVPAGVDAADWSVISSPSASAEHIGQAVQRILTNIRERLSLESPSNFSTGSVPDFADIGRSETNSPSGGNVEELLTDEEQIVEDV